MLLTTHAKQSKHSDQDKDLNITMQGKQINNASEETLLGVFIDSNLSWKAQIQKVRRCVLFQLSILRTVRKYLPTHIRILYYNYYVKPQLPYCCCIWGHCSKKRYRNCHQTTKTSCTSSFRCRSSSTISTTFL